MCWTSAAFHQRYAAKPDAGCTRQLFDQMLPWEQCEAALRHKYSRSTALSTLLDILPMLLRTATWIGNEPHLASFLKGPPALQRP